MRRVLTVLILSSIPLFTQKATSYSSPGRTVVSTILLSLTPFGADAHPAKTTTRKSALRMATPMTFP
jgi:hypothetical protein